MAWWWWLLGASVLRLLMIDAGPLLHFEHVRLASAWTRGGPGAFDWFGAAVFVGLFAAAAWRLRDDIRSGLHSARARVGPGGMVCVLAVLIVTVALPTPRVVDAGLDVSLSLLIRCTLLALTWLAIRDMPVGWSARIAAAWSGLLAADDSASTAVRRLPQLAAGFSLVVSALLAFYAYERMPHAPDEVAYLYQARYFAAGLLVAPVPPVPAGFEIYLVDCSAGRCISPFPPGWPAVLALGVLAGAAWLVNPLLGAVNVLLTFRLARTLWDVRVARLAALLLAISPWHLFMSMSFMSHTSSLTCALVAAWSVATAHRTGRALPCVAGGAALGFIGLTRPLEAMVGVVVLGVAALFVRGRAFRFAPLLVLAACSAAVAALNAPYNALLTGDARLFPVTQYMDAYWGPGMNDLGFGPDRNIRFGGLDPFPGHGLRDVAVNAQIGLSQLQTELFGWGPGSLWPALFLLILRRARGYDWWLVAWIVTAVASQTLYWFSGGPDFGARYWYTVIVPLVLLSARGLLELDARQDRALVPPGAPPHPWAAAAAVSAVLALGLFVPWRAIDKYHRFRATDPGMRTLLASRDFGRSLILVRGLERPDYASALNFTPIDPYADGPVVFWAKDDATEAALRRAYPDRTVHVVHGPSRVGDGFRVVMTSPAQDVDD
jgi:Dolichyl-phosphate-mannose-protein mannosyltransferase